MAAELNETNQQPDPAAAAPARDDAGRFAKPLNPDVTVDPFTGPLGDAVDSDPFLSESGRAERDALEAAGDGEPAAKPKAPAAGDDAGGGAGEPAVEPDLQALLSDDGEGDGDDAAGGDAEPDLTPEQIIAALEARHPGAGAAARAALKPAAAAPAAPPAPGLTPSVAEHYRKLIGEGKDLEAIQYAAKAMVEESLRPLNEERARSAAIQAAEEKRERDFQAFQKKYPDWRDYADGMRTVLNGFQKDLGVEAARKIRFERVYAVAKMMTGGAKPAPAAAPANKKTAAGAALATPKPAGAPGRGPGARVASKPADPQAQEITSTMQRLAREKLLRNPF